MGDVSERKMERDRLREAVKREMPLLPDDGVERIVDAWQQVVDEIGALCTHRSGVAIVSTLDHRTVACKICSATLVKQSREQPYHGWHTDYERPPGGWE